MITVIQGFLVVVSMLIPGVSGATMMIVFGIYNKTLSILSSWSKRKFVQPQFIFLLILGGLIGLTVFPMIMVYFLRQHGYWMGFFFTGIVLAGLRFLLAKIDVKEINLSVIGMFLVGLFIALWMSYSPRFSLLVYGGDWYERLIMVFVAGVVIALALILPGISASYMLLLMGIYDRLLIALSNLQIQVLVPLILGVVIGGLVSVRFLNWLVKIYPNQLYALISGFVLGSIPLIFPGIPRLGHVTFAMLWFTLGLLLIYVLHKYSQTDML